MVRWVGGFGSMDSVDGSMDRADGSIGSVDGQKGKRIEKASGIYVYEGTTWWRSKEHA